MVGQADLVVIGGGPAGAVSAWLAARDGARVVLVDPDRAPARVEGLSPRLLDWLHRSGLPCPPEVPLVRVSRRSLWSGTAHEGNREILVARPAFDRHLRDCARSAGAGMVTGTATPLPGGALLDTGRRIEAALVIDARGRRGSRRDGLRRGPPSVAIGGWLDGPADTPAQSAVVPFDEGWLWFACLGGGRAWVQATLDAGTSARPPRDRLAHALGCCAGLLPPGFRLADAAPVVRECAPLLSAVPDDLSVIPVGDAAAAMDPLSGHGMFWAVSSAIAAAAVRRSLADDPGGRMLARRFLSQRGEDVFLRQARIGRDFIRAETGRAALPFWQARAGFPDDEAAHGPVAGLSVRRQVVVQDGRLAELEVLVSARSPGGVAWFRDLPAAELWRAHAEGADDARLRQRFGPAAGGFPDWLAQQAVAGSGAL